MKSIEEEAEAFSLEQSDYLDERLLVENAFQAGAAFAQEWVSVEDEYPEDYDIVLVKTDSDCVSTAYFHGKRSRFVTYGEEAYEEFGNIIAWRPIERM